MKRGGFGAIAVAIFAALMSLYAAGATAAVPTSPVAFEKGTPLKLTSAASDYWVYVPESYDASGNTPTKLFVWMHGCGGDSSGDIWTVSPGGAQDWISVSVGGRDGGCWSMGSDGPKVLNAVSDVETHFNIDSRRVILGGYSSGGDLAYRTAFLSADTFAGVLAMNTSPFRDTGSTREALLAAATWKFNVVHVAHIQDTTYPIAGVREETNAMISAGYPVTRVEVDGTHWDAPGDVVNGHAVPGTDADIRSLLLPHIGDGWMSPEPELTEPPDPDPDPGPGPSPVPRVTFTGKPGKVTKSRVAKFSFKSSVAGSSFQCRIDDGGFKACKSPKTYRPLRRGTHRFRVRAVAAGVTGPAAEFRWKIKRRQAVQR